LGLPLDHSTSFLGEKSLVVVVISRRQPWGSHLACPSFKIFQDTLGQQVVHDGENTFPGQRSDLTMEKVDHSTYFSLDSPQKKMPCLIEGSI
jgi:hypothetical protein